MTPIVGRGHEQEQRTVDPDPAAERALELGGGAQALRGPKTTSPRRQPQAPIRLRPFWRRRLRTRRPPLLRIRTRKPWVRFRFRLFGWNVRFIYGCPSSGRPLSEPACPGKR